VWPAVLGEELVKQKKNFASWGVGGAVVMTFPATATGEQLLAFKNAGKVPMLLATDEEGGIVQRFKRVGVLPIPATVPSTMTPAQIQAAVAAHAKVLKTLGIDVVYAPVADVSPATGDGPIGNRAFSDDPAVVTAYDQAYIAGWESAGITPVIKHFPGHGSASADTHKATATTPSLADLERRDLLPYAALVDSGAGVMVGHLTVPGLTDAEGVPASLSKAAITDLLRRKYGYTDALVFTDALGMQAVAVKFKVPVAAEKAIEAGADVAIFTSTADAPLVVAQLEAAVRAGRLTRARLNDAVSHVLRTKHLDPCTLTL
jgi:beta-N-acetylhexosaminidase